MSTPRYEIVHGGQPSLEELAAIVVALTPVVVVPEPDDDQRISGWQRAAVWEAVGRRNFTSADDIDAAPPVFS